MTSGRSVADLFFEAARRYADRPFLHIPSDTRAVYGLSTAGYTYEEARSAIEDLVQAYEGQGCGPGRRIGLALENRPDFFLHFLAVNKLGASALPLNCAMTPEELAFQISHSECELIVSTLAHRARLARAAARTVNSPSVIGPMEIAQSRALFTRPAPGADVAGKEAAILYTSGTTGKPKGCVLSNDYFAAIGDLYANLGGLVRFDEGRDRIITPLPVTHMNALACSFMAAIRTGSCLIQLDRFHPSTWWNSVRESHATIMHYLGVMPALLLKAPPAGDEIFGDEIKFGFGAGCDPRHHQAFEERFGFPLIEAWAMTETGAGAWITASEEPRHVGTRCFGRAPIGLEWRIVDEEGRDAATGEAGELLVRRSGANPRRNFFSGYYRDEAATEDAWRGGWFHTGDAVRVDEAGHFYFVDRLKSLIRRSGENIAAIEVESALARHPAVAASVVVPVADELRGEEVMALVIPAKGSGDGALARAIFDFALQNLTYFKAPGYIAFVEAIPLTATEKVKRGEAKAIGRALAERGDCFDFTGHKKPGKEAARKRRPRASYGDVALAAPVSIAYQRYSDETAHWWIGRALKSLADKTGLGPLDIDGFCASSFTLRQDTAVALTQHLGLSPRWLDHIPMGGASGIVAMRRAARAVQSGDAEIVVCVAGDANHRQSFRETVAGFSRFSAGAIFPYGAAGPNAPFALITRAYMKAYGATREDFGRICISQRDNALSNPQALMKAPLSMEDYLSARPIAEPLHLFDCVMPCAGAEGFLVMREERARELSLPFVRVLSTIERHNAFASDPIQLRGGWAVDRRELWSMAGVSPADVDFIETYDDYPVITMMQIEDLGFCEKGGAKDFVRSHSLTVDGTFPHNTSGGQLSVGQAGAAGGYLGLVEAIRQLTGETLGRPVKGAKIGAVSGFGMINYDRGVCFAAAILASGGAHG